MTDFSLPALIAKLLILLIAFPVHEFAHAWAATELGDPTPARQGRLTLNPLAHLDLFGAILLLGFGFGWAKPVMTQPAYLRYGPRAGSALVAAAGPFSNLLLAILAALPFRFGLFGLDLFAHGSLLSFLPSMLSVFVVINLLLLFFNLIPLPPLDGHRVAVGVLPYRYAEIFYRLEPWGPFILMLLLFGGNFIGINIVGALIGPPMRALASLLLG